MYQTTPETAFKSFLYGAGAMLLGFDVFFLVRALFTSNFVPILPILIGILTAGGLLLIVYAEQRAREEHHRDHRRISRVAHQLEAPLSSLETDLAYLLKQADSLPSEARMKLKQMDTKTDVLIENIRDMFLMLQADEQPIAREMRTYDLCQLVDDAIKKHQKQASARNVEMVYKAHCKTAPVHIDKSLMRIVLNHLIENAIVYSMKPGLVNIAIARNDKRVRVIVQDRGTGINEADANIIWQPFARGVRAAEFDPDGIGVGLTLSRLIIQEFDGQLVFKNKEKGAGAEFEIVLPLAAK